MRELRLHGIITHLNYSSEDVDEEKEMEAPPEFQTQPLKQAEEPVTKNIPSLLAAHLRETKRKKERYRQGERWDTAMEKETRTTSYTPSKEKQNCKNSLPNKVVLNYEDLKRRFRTHFNQQKKQTKTHLAINGIKIREGESVRAFITRYIDEITQIIRLNEDQRISGFVHRVKIKSLVKFLSTELLRGYDELMKKVYSWLQVEDSTSKGRPVTFMDGVAGEKPQKRRPWEGVGKKNKERRDKYSPYKEPNLWILKSLTKSPREILAFEKVVKTFTKPPMMVSKTKDTSKYSELHQDYGHETNTRSCQIKKVNSFGKKNHDRESQAHRQTTRRVGRANNKGRTHHRGEPGAYPYDQNTRQPFKKERTLKNHKHQGNDISPI
nr:hypothetical protein [Tanacetum cinerariifolium]